MMGFTPFQCFPKYYHQDPAVPDLARAGWQAVKSKLFSYLGQDHQSQRTNTDEVPAATPNFYSTGLRRSQTNVGFNRANTHGTYDISDNSRRMVGSGNSRNSVRGEFSRSMPTDDYSVYSKRPTSRYQQRDTLDRFKGHSYGDYQIAPSFSRGQQRSEQAEQVNVGGTIVKGDIFREVALPSERGDVGSKRQPTSRLGRRKARAPEAENQEHNVTFSSLLEQTDDGYSGYYSSGLRAPRGVRAGMKWRKSSGGVRGGALRPEDLRTGGNEAVDWNEEWRSEEKDGGRERRARRDRSRPGRMRSVM